MRIGVLKEIKTKEHRVAITPEGVEQMREHGLKALEDLRERQVVLGTVAPVDD